MSKARERKRKEAILTLDYTKLCPNCSIYPKAEDAHECPYSNELGGMTKNCFCCDRCTVECEQDV